MKASITCFLVYENEEKLNQSIAKLQEEPTVAQIYLLMKAPQQLPDSLSGCRQMVIEQPQALETLRMMSEATTTPHLLFFTKAVPFDMGYEALERFADYLNVGNSALAYSDYYVWTENSRQQHPVIDYQEGSVRDDFDFGSCLCFSASKLEEALKLLSHSKSYKYAGLYAVRLALSSIAHLIHIREYLYTELQTDFRQSGEKQFDYVNPRNREVQIEMEEAFTAYLKQQKLLLPPPTKRLDFKEQDFAIEASVIIPVRNRVRTIADAIESVLSQSTDFPFNVIIVDNHSTDGTTEVIERYKQHPQVIHIIPDRDDLGIGGCWNLGINHPQCGRFAVQLDSDDLYSTSQTLQTIVNKFYEEGCAMVIGSYRMTDFNLQTLPPGLIDHREWTYENGANNALRINGLGAPRAFYTPLLRSVRLPNTSYGEDYAVGLAFSRTYRIGRIYDELYLCRRWEGNSDAALSIDKVNNNNSYKDSLRTLEIQRRRAFLKEMSTRPVGIRFIADQLSNWETARRNHEALNHVETRTFMIDENEIHAQFNPMRAVSSEAKLDDKSIAERPCFLCLKNKPAEQDSVNIHLNGGSFNIRLNPYPILPGHLTISSDMHEPQSLSKRTNLHLPEQLVEQLQHFIPDYAVFYNGAKCGASAPDHFHFQALPAASIPLIRQWDRLMLTAELIGTDKHSDGRVSESYLVKDYVVPVYAFIVDQGYSVSERLQQEMLARLPIEGGESEPRFNLFAWKDAKRGCTLIYIPRKRHRPACFDAEGDARLRISPGALDMAGILVTTRKEDFDRLSTETIKTIYKEVGLL